MSARLRKLFNDLAETFWLLPGLLVLAGIGGALGLVMLDRRGLVGAGLLDSGWLYDGGATGARTLLGAVASSTIGVAGTYGNMRHGWTDETWAKEHHEYWYNDVKSRKRAPGGAVPAGAPHMKEEA